MGTEYFIKGRMTTGYAILMDINEKKIDFTEMPKVYRTPKLANMKRLSARTSWMIASIKITQDEE